MKRLIILLIFLLIGCKTTQQITEYNQNFSYQQVDSIMSSEKFGWNNVDSVKFMDYETKQIITEYYYLQGNKVFRIIKLDNDSIQVTKRVY